VLQRLDGLLDRGVRHRAVGPVLLSGTDVPRHGATGASRQHVVGDHDGCHPRCDGSGFAPSWPAVAGSLTR
jgi:hypothetical protein